VAGFPCAPGRHFEKQEILLTIAMLVSRFEFEFMEWMVLDGETAERPSKNDTEYG